MTQAELPTTDGALALGNLDAEIAGLERDVAKDPSLDRAGALVEGLASRGQFLGRLADYERAAALADAAVARSGNDARAYAMRAKARAIFHRFGDARADLDRVEALGAPAPLAQRAAILQAEGRYDEALTIRHRLSEQKADLSSLASEASVLADMGETDRAERLFNEALHHFRDVSPFGPAWLWFQQGLMWEKIGKPTRARALHEAACSRVPGFAHAVSHLASLLPGERALHLLEPVVASSDDPEYEAQLGSLLRENGRGAEGDRHVARARETYDRLTRDHPEAFADHAARFWLAAGSEPQKALLWARKNVETRSTPDSLTLLVDAAIDAHDAAASCAAAEQASSWVGHWGSRHLLAARAFDACGLRERADQERRVASAGP